MMKMKPFWWLQEQCRVKFTFRVFGQNACTKIRNKFQVMSDWRGVTEHWGFVMFFIGIYHVLWEFFTVCQSPLTGIFSLGWSTNVQLNARPWTIFSLGFPAPDGQDWLIKNLNTIYVQLVQKQNWHQHKKENLVF